MSGFFQHPGVFLAWGIGGGDFTPEEIVDRAADAGFKWVCQEYGSPDGRPDAPDDLIVRLRGHCHVRGLYFGAWEVQPRTLDTFARVRPNFWILNVEDDYSDYGPLLAQLRAAHPRLPAAVITNGGLNPKPFIHYNIKAIPEAYAGSPGQDPNTTPDNMVARCKQEGWTLVFPCLGVFDGGTLASYKRAGDGWSVYLAETMQPADWETAKAWNT